MNPTPRHIDGLDLRGGGFLDRLEIGFANLEIVFDNLPERPQRQMEFRRLFSAFGVHIKHQPFVTDRQAQMVRPLWHRAIIARRQGKNIVLQQIKHGDLALLLYLGRGRGQVRVVKRDMRDPGHGDVSFSVYPADLRPGGGVLQLTSAGRAKGRCVSRSVCAALR